MKILLINHKSYFIFNFFILLFAFAITSTAVSSELDDILKDVKEDYDVRHISNKEFRELSANDVVIFDVRKLKEYQVSHIKNAIHLSPRTSIESFFKQHAEKLKGKTVVFYCSVGERSSKMLSKLNNKLTDAGVQQAYNLEGGAFKWHNDKIDFVKGDKPTRHIHPYNAYWGQLIDDKSSIKYQ